MFVTYPRVYPFDTRRRPHPSGFEPAHRTRASPRDIASLRGVLLRGVLLRARCSLRVTAQGNPSLVQFHHQYFKILSYSPGIATFSSIIKN